MTTVGDPMPAVGGVLHDTTKTLDPALSHAVLRSKLKRLDKRRAEIEVLLGMKRPGDVETHQSLELRSELQNLNALRIEIEQTLKPPKVEVSAPLAAAMAKQRQRDISNLRSMIAEHTRIIQWNADRAEQTGDHRSARLFRQELLDLPESLCRQFKLDPSLLDEVDNAP